MKIKFIDYDLEYKGFWNCGFRYWLTENRISKRGKEEAIIVILTNSISEVKEKIKELKSIHSNIEFEQTESLKQLKGDYNNDKNFNY
jgi:hypothetical protein